MAVCLKIKNVPPETSLSKLSDDVISPPPINGAQDLHENVLYWRYSIWVIKSNELFVQGPSPKRRVQKPGRQRQKTSGEQLFEIIMSGKGALQVSNTTVSTCSIGVAVSPHGSTCI